MRRITALALLIGLSFLVGCGLIQDIKDLKDKQICIDNPLTKEHCAPDGTTKGYEIAVKCLSCVQGLNVAGPIPLKIELTLNTTQGAATVYWDFGDGTAAKGLTVQHEYSDVATYSVGAEILKDDGTHIDVKSVSVTAYPPEGRSDSLTSVDTGPGKYCQVTRDVFVSQASDQVLFVKLTFTAIQDVYSLRWMDSWSGSGKPVNVDTEIVLPEDHHKQQFIPAGTTETRVYNVQLLPFGEGVDIYGEGSCVPYNNQTVKEILDIETVHLHGLKGEVK